LLLGACIVTHMQHSYTCVHRYCNKGINWNFWQFLMNLIQVNNFGSCEPLGDLFHLSYNYKCICFNLNIQHIKLQCKLWPFWTSDQHQNYHWGHRGSLSYGGWIYSYLCNQCQFTSNVVSSNSGQVMCNRYIIMLWSLSVNWGRSSFFSRYSGRTTMAPMIVLVLIRSSKWSKFTL
jgi:hypothetical protein